MMQGTVLVDVAIDQVDVLKQANPQHMKNQLFKRRNSPLCSN